MSLAFALATVAARFVTAAMLVACVLVLVSLVRHDLPTWRDR